MAFCAGGVCSGQGGGGGGGDGGGGGGGYFARTLSGLQGAAWMSGGENPEPVVQFFQQPIGSGGGSSGSWILPRPRIVPPVPHCGVNPVTNQQYIGRQQDGIPGDYRPGREGGGTYGAPRGTQANRRIHQGIDIAGPLGADIHSSLAGTVTAITGSATDTTGYGLTVWVDVGGGVTMLYAHLGSTSATVGQSLGGGDVLGELGQSGNADGQPLSEAHLHFEVRRSGASVNASTFLNSACSGLGTP